MVRIESLDWRGHNAIFVEYDGFHFEGTIREVINELLTYERREIKRRIKNNGNK